MLYRLKIPPTPPDSKFFHQVDEVDEPRDWTMGIWIFSPYATCKDVKCWSHDREFPWFLEHHERSFLLDKPEEQILIASAAHVEWMELANRPNTPRRLHPEKLDKLMCQEIADGWLKWKNNPLEIIHV